MRGRADGLSIQGNRTSCSGGGPGEQGRAASPLASPLPFEIAGCISIYSHGTRLNTQSPLKRAGTKPRASRPALPAACCAPGQFQVLRSPAESRTEQALPARGRCRRQGVCSHGLHNTGRTLVAYRMGPGLSRVLGAGSLRARPVQSLFCLRTPLSPPSPLLPEGLCRSPQGWPRMLCPGPAQREGRSWSQGSVPTLLQTLV